MLTFNRKYFMIFIVIFVTEIMIAIFIHDKIIRPHIGDLLVVILIYAFLKAFFKFKALYMAIGVLIFAYLIEYLQFLNITKALNLENSTFIKLTLGNSFGWIDMICYTLGIGIVLLFDCKKNRHKFKIIFEPTFKHTYISYRPFTLR